MVSAIKAGNQSAASRNGNGLERANLVKEESITIEAPNFQTIPINIIGTIFYMQKRVSQKTIADMRKKQEAGSKPLGEKKPEREKKDFKKMYEDSLYRPCGGGYGIPASAFKKAMIQVTRIIKTQAVTAKMAFRIEHDDLDKIDGTPLVKITHGEPSECVMPVRLETGVMDLCNRPRWQPGWKATVKVTFDADVFKAKEIVNLLYRAGQEVGIGEGRPFVNPKRLDASGLGYGLFEIVEK